MRRTSFEARPPRKEMKKSAGHASNYGRVLLAFLVFLGYVVGLSLIGYFAATFLFVLGLSWSIGPRRAGELPKLALMAVGNGHRNVPHFREIPVRLPPAGTLLLRVFMDLVLPALFALFEPKMFLSLCAGIFAGVVGGAIPGITITMTIILTLPFTFGMPPCRGWRP